MAGTGRGTPYWRARAESLAASNERLRARLLALHRLLPPEYSRLFEEDLEALEANAAAWDIFDGWHETTGLTPGDVATEMRLLWERLAPTGNA
jgi:hypothetical protein